MWNTWARHTTRAAGNVVDGGIGDLPDPGQRTAPARGRGVHPVPGLFLTTRGGHTCADSSGADGRAATRDAGPVRGVLRHRGQVVEPHTVVADPDVLGRLTGAGRSTPHQPLVVITR